MTESNKTKVNEESLFDRINKFSAKKVNTNNTYVDVQLLTGSVLNGKYKVVQKLSSGGGESDIYIANTNDGKRYVVKIYHRKKTLHKNKLQFRYN